MALDQVTANSLMQRMMTTGVPTAELAQYGGYDAVAQMYKAGGGGYSRSEIPQEAYNDYAQQIANTGVGNLSVLADTNTPLTQTGLQAMNANGVNLDSDWLMQHGIPVAQAIINQPTAQPSGSGNASTTGSSSSTKSTLIPGVQQKLQNLGTFGASGNERMSAGNGEYSSDLIQALRTASPQTLSSNQGFTKYGNQSTPTSVSSVTNQQNKSFAFNPEALGQEVASADDVLNWDSYNTYRTNSLNAKSPYISFSEWLIGGKPDGKAVEQPAYQYQYDTGGGG